MDDDDYIKSAQIDGIKGFSYEIVPNETTAWHLHQEKHLIWWRSDEKHNIRLDTYDARNLLEDKSTFIRRKRQRNCINETETNSEHQTKYEEAIHQSRYQDYNVEFPSTKTESPLDMESKTILQSQENVAVQLENAEEKTCLPTWHVPANLEYPPLQKDYNVLVATATAIKKNPQLEFVLRVKQQDNPKFSFLSSTCPYHEYYKYVKSISAPTHNKIQRPKLLGAEYSDSDEEQEIIDLGMQSNIKETETHEVNMKMSTCPRQIAQMIAMRLKNEVLQNSFSVKDPTLIIKSRKRERSPS